jgi:putative MATE family efflux protein
MALQFLMVAAGAALRAVGNFKAGMVVSTGSVLTNMVLAPFLIFGWGTGHAFGVAGAAMSSLVAIIVAVIWFAAYFFPKDSYLRFVRADLKPRLALWRKMLNIGLPSGFEFAMMGVYLVMVYAIARPFGAAAQAGFGIGQRVIQALFMPAVALGFSVAPVAGQNFGARSRARVVDTFRKAAYMVTAVMVLLVILCLSAPHALIGVFSKDPAVLAVGSEYLRIVSWNFVASGLIFVASSMFQAMGNTVPSLVASGTRILIVAVPAILLSRRAGFQLNWIWYLSVGAVFIQLVQRWSRRSNECSRVSCAGADGSTGRVANRNHDLATRVTRRHVSHRLRRFFQRVAAIDDRSYATTLDQFPEHIQVVAICARDERREFASRERLAQHKR